MHCNQQRLSSFEITFCRLRDCYSDVVNKNSEEFYSLCHTSCRAFCTRSDPSLVGRREFIEDGGGDIFEFRITPMIIRVCMKKNAHRMNE